MKAERLQGSHTNPLLGREMDLSISECSHSHNPTIFPELSFSWFNSTFYACCVAKIPLLKVSLRKWVLLDFLFFWQRLTALFPKQYLEVEPGCENFLQRQFT